MVIFWNNTIVFLTGGCSDINGTVPHSQILPQETRMQSDALLKWKPCLI